MDPTAVGGAGAPLDPPLDPPLVAPSAQRLARSRVRRLVGSFARLALGWEGGRALGKKLGEEGYSCLLTVPFNKSVSAF